MPQPSQFQPQPPPQSSQQPQMPTLPPQTTPQLSQAIDRSARLRRVRRGTKMRLIVLAVIAIVLIGVTIFFFVMRNKNVPLQRTSEDTAVQPSVINPSNTESVTNTPLTEPVRDSDGDGLLDTEEAEFGTNPDSLDSDNDGLNDRQEIRVYKTEPMIPDTDGDGFEDGEEVRQFYNPTGEGKLLDESTLIKELNTNQ